MSTIPHKFNRLGLSKGSSFNFDKGLVFYAPMDGSDNIIGNGSTLVNSGWEYSNRENKTGLRFNISAFTYSKGCAYNVPNFPNAKNPFTISLWYNFLKSDFYNQTLNAQYNMALFYFGARTFDKQIGYEVSVDDIYQPDWAWTPSEYIEIYKNNFNLIDDGKWHCFVTAYDGIYVYIFQDGVLIAQYQTTTLNITNKQFYIGSRVGDRRYWRGLLNNITIHDYCFTEADAKGFMDYTK